MTAAVITGQRIGDRFVVETQAGAGGMGTVYRCRDEVTGALAAVKVLELLDDESRARFDREIALLAKIEHPAVVGDLAHGDLPSGEPWLAMQWIDGEDLAARLGRGRLEIDEVRDLAARIADALTAAHAQGLVHRDLTPRNLFLRGGSLTGVTILDFGLARSLGPDSGVTGTGVLLGTPGYIAPEQARGTKTLDQRADIFALGAVLYQCLAGRRPFRGSTAAAVLTSILLDEPPRLSRLRNDCPAEVEALIGRMLAKDPSNRPADANALALEIASVDWTPAAPTAAAVSLSAEETRVVSIVLATAVDIPLTGSWFEDNAELVTKVQHMGGTCEQLADGSLVLSFAAASSASEQAARAARSALELHASLRGASVYVATSRGTVAGGAPVGEVVDEATTRMARLGRDNGGVRLDDSTAALLDGAFEITGDPAGPVLLAERVISSASGPGSRARRCVGRSRELSLLTGAYEDCESEEIARVALITGAAGIGKSRLVRELLDRLERRGDPLTVLWGRGEAMRAGAPFALLAPVIREAADLDPQQTPERQRARLEGLVDSDSACFLGEMVGVLWPDDAASESLRAARRDPMLMSDAIRSAWERWLTARAEAQPVLLVLEDLHWGDVPSVKAIDATVRNLAELPIMVVATMRPELPFPTPWASHDPVRVFLEPLSDKVATKLAKALLGDAADTVVHFVVARAAGNPFYLEELALAVGQSIDHTLPIGLLGTLQSRMDRYGAAGKRVLRAASVFGERFWTNGVAALLQGAQTVASVQAILSELEAAELIVSQQASGLAGQTEHRFAHGLMRDAAYAMLTDDDRAVGHSLAGAWLESAGERDAVVLAGHFSLGRAPDRAGKWYAEAAHRAIAGGDLEAAITRADDALAVQKDAAQAGALLHLQAEASFWLGRVEVSQSQATAAIERLAAGSPRWFRAIGTLITAAGQQGDNDTVQRWLQAVLDTKASAEAGDERVVAASRAVTQLIPAGRHDAVAHALKQLKTTALESRGALSQAWLHRAHALQALHAGRLEVSLHAIRKAKQAYAVCGDARAGSLCSMGIGWAHTYLGELEAALDALAEAEASATRLGSRYGVLWARFNRGKALTHLGRYDEARAIELEVATALADSPRIAGAARVYLSIIAYRLDDPGTAEAEARAALQMEIAPPLAVVARACLALALIKAGRPAEAVELSGIASEALSRLGGVEELASLVRLARAEALQAAGDLQAAAAAIAEAKAQLEADAAQIEDATRRDAFLHRLPHHARTLALATALGV